MNKIINYATIGHYASDWYRDANSEIRRFARLFGHHPDYVADVVAILSPRVQVVRNARLAAKYILFGETDGIMAQRVEALHDYEITGEVYGPKVSAFAKNLRGDYNVVTVDVWMSRAFGVNFDTITDNKREYIQTQVTRVARRFGCDPASAQAAIWAGYRESIGHGNSEGSLSMVAATHELENRLLEAA